MGGIIPKPIHGWTEDTLWEVMWIGGGPRMILDEQPGVRSSKTWAAAVMAFHSNPQAGMLRGLEIEMKPVAHRTGKKQLLP